MPYKRKSYQTHGIPFARRKRARTTVKYRKYRPMSKKRSFRASRFRKAVMSVVNRNAEVKEVMRTIASNQTVTHNTVLNLENNAFYCEKGVEGGNHSSGAQRIGNRIFVKGFKVALMLENQQYRPKATYWLYLVRTKGNSDSAITQQSHMFESLTSTIPMDYIDTSKVDVMFSKKIVVTMPNSGTTLAGDSTVTGAFYEESQGMSYEMVTNPQKILKFYVPCNFNIQYHDSTDNNASVPSTMRYQWVLCAYNNFSSTTNSSVYPLGHVTMSTKMRFTDV